MAQPPFLVDGIQIEPGSGQVLTITRDPTTGALHFVDHVLLGGVLLPQLVGLRNVTGVYIVGRGGDGAPYTSIQDALDAIPTSSSIEEPAVVLVLPGQYEENIVVQKDGVSIVGLGGVVLTSDSGSTVEVSAALDSTPQNVTLQNLTIQGDTCVSLVGADSFASAQVTVSSAPLVAGDTITIGGVTLTGVSGTRTSGSNNFTATSNTTDAIAANIVAAINDNANGFSSLVTASATLNVVTLTVVTAGSGGNAITLVSSTTPAGGLPVSGATLTGGGSAGSMVGDGEVSITNCNLQADTTQIQATTVGHILVSGGSWRGSASLSNCSIANCAQFMLMGVDGVQNLEFSYDSSEDQPNDPDSEYVVSGVPSVGDVLSNLEGVGSLTLSNCARVSSIEQDGDRPLILNQTHVEDLLLSGTTQASLYGSSRNLLSLGGGAPTIREPKTFGELNFVTTDSVDFSFDVLQVDAEYTVLMEPSFNTTLSVVGKTEEGFTVQTGDVVTGTVGLSILRNL
jgi:hypothetical protein